MMAETITLIADELATCSLSTGRHFVHLNKLPGHHANQTSVSSYNFNFTRCVFIFYGLEYNRV